ncbi:hypothetical protein ACLB2K_011306 [Fragaria x ananassa]
MTTMISEWVRAVAEKSQTIPSKLLLLAPIISSRLQPRTTSQEEEEEKDEEEEEGGEEEWRCFNSNNNNSMQMADNKQSCWSDLPSDILCEVVNRLPYWDLVRSAAVCKTWRLVIRKVHLLQRSTLLVPYMMSCTCIRDGKHVHRSKNPIELEISHVSKNSIEFLDMEGETYKYTVRHLDQTDLGPCESKYGWFLLYRQQLYVRKQYYYLYNPFCNEVIQLPSLHDPFKKRRLVARGIAKWVQYILKRKKQGYNLRVVVAAIFDKMEETCIDEHASIES